MKTILVYTGVFTAFRNDLRPHYTTECTCHMTYIPTVYVLGVVEWGIYLYKSMGTTSMMLLFTRSSSIRRVNVGSHAIVFKSLRFGTFTLKRNPGVFKLKLGLQHFQKSPFSRVKNGGVV